MTLGPPGDTRSTRQMVLDLTRAPSYAADDFLVSPTNCVAHDTVLRWPYWAARTLMLIGPPGSGKSHLGAIWAALSGASRLQPDGLASMNGGDSALVFLEDGDRGTWPEATLFHLINLVEETAGWLLITARARPDLWGVRLPDVLSRLRRAPIVEIGLPDQAFLRSIIVKLFADRQIRIDADVVAFAALHCERSLDAVARFVAAVDEAALAEGRRITRPLASRTLAALDRTSRKATEAAPERQGPT